MQHDIVILYVYIYIARIKVIEHSILLESPGLLLLGELNY